MSSTSYTKIMIAAIRTKGSEKSKFSFRSPALQTVSSFLQVRVIFLRVAESILRNPERKNGVGKNEGLFPLHTKSSGDSTVFNELLF